MQGVKLAALLCAVFVQGCANQSIYRPLNLDAGQGVLIDAKQRAIYLGRDLPGKPNRPRNGVVCPEPSPDAISVLASSGALASEKLGAELAYARQEAAASIGVRTASIQLMRDQMTFNCLDYLNGIIDEQEYDFRVRRTQRYSLALLAVEHLAGVAQAPAVAIGANASATARDQSTSLQISKLQKEVKDLETKKTAESDETKKKDLETQVAAKNDQIKSLQTKTTESKPTSAAGGTETKIAENPGSNSQAGAASIIGDIVRLLITTDDLPGVCIAELQKIESTPNAKPITQLCLSVWGFDSDGKPKGAAKSGQVGFDNGPPALLRDHKNLQGYGNGFFLWGK